MATMRKKKPTSNESSPGQFDWSIACELLETGQYEPVARFLDEAQAVNETTDRAILAAAHRICLVCSQYRAETEWHRRAYDEANRREQELRQQLYAILNSFRERGASRSREKQNVQPSIPAPQISASEDNSPESAEIPSFLERIQGLLGWKTDSKSANKAVSDVLVDVPTGSSGENGEVLPEHDELPAALPRRSLDSPHVKSDEQVDNFSSSPITLVVYCLGPFRVYQNEQLIEDWSSRKGQAIFKYLITHRQSPVSKDILMDIFWPEADPEAARRNLHQAIYALRQILKIGYLDFQHIQFENDCYRLNPALNIWLDNEEFEQHVQAGRKLEDSGAPDKAMTEYGMAEGLYRDDFMAEDLYEDWTQVRRQNLSQTYLSVAYRLAQYYLDQNEHAAAIALNQRILAIDHSQEKAHQNLMRCYLAHGQRQLAIRQYQLCTQALQAELDVSPSDKTQAFYQQIITG